MSDVHLATAFAGDAAQVEDTLGLPSYAQFKKYATFRTDLTDFGVDIRQLSRLLAECDYGLAVGGMGLGDIHILFNSLAKRTRALNFEGVLRLCRLLRPRLAKVEAMMEAPDPDQQDPTKYRPQTAGTGTGAALWAAARGLLPLTTSIRNRGPNRTASTHPPVDFAAGMAAGEGGGGAAAAAAATPAAAPPAAQASTAAPGPGRGVSFQQQQQQVKDREGGSASPAASSGQTRPGSASRLAIVSGGDVGLAAAAATAGGGGGGGSGPSTSGRSAVPNGLSSLMALKDPPVLLREHLLPPSCNYPAIAARISGIMVLYRDGEMTRVGLALRDLQRDWEDAASAAAIAAAIRRQAKAAPGAPVETSEGDLRGQIPLEGRIWLLLLHGCGLMMEGKHRAARKSLQAAESLFSPNVMGMEHPYHYTTHMFFGLLNYYEQLYEDAIEKFECARELADLVSRGSFNVIARRNAAACLNNKGVCHSLLGNRSDAVIAFRAAYQMLRSVDGASDVPEALVAQRNLTKALKAGFALNTSRLRPTSAPAMYSRIGSTAMQTFLRSAITMKAPPPVTAVPAWCTKVTADDIVARKKAKEAEKKARAKAAEKAKNGGNKGKAGAKLKKAPPFDEMTTYPFASYGLANVKLAAKKGRKKKAPPP